MSELFTHEEFHRFTRELYGDPYSPERPTEWAIFIERRDAMAAAEYQYMVKHHGEHAAAVALQESSDDGLTRLHVAAVMIGYAATKVLAAMLTERKLRERAENLEALDSKDMGHAN